MFYLLFIRLNKQVFKFKVEKCIKITNIFYIFIKNTVNQLTQLHKQLGTPKDSPKLRDNM